MRASRLLAILMLLQAQGRLSARALAAATEVSVRTIYRDIDQLSAAGVPVWAETGRAGGICLREGWRTELTGLTAPEARAVFLAGLPGPAAELGLGEAMAAAQLKLLAALPADAREDAGRMARVFHLDPVDWFRSAAPPAHLKALADAIWTQRRVAMRYASWDRVSERVVDPLGLVLKAGTWYLVARRSDRSDRSDPSDRSEPAVYRLAAIEQFEVLETRFQPPAAFELAAFWRGSTARFEAGVYTASARLRVDEEGLQRLCCFSPAVAHAALESATPCEPPGFIEVAVPIESIEHAANEMLRLGRHGEVLEPAALRERMQATARALMRLYAG